LINLQLSAIISSTIFNSNVGGAIIFSSLLAAVTLQVTNCSFTNNQINPYNDNSGLGGAAILIDGSALINSSVFLLNSASYGGAITVMQNSLFTIPTNVTILSSVFQSNLATEGGGAILAQDMDYLFLSNCLFLNNTSVGGGGALYIHNVGQLILDNSQLTQNKASLSPSSTVGGGAVFMSSDTDFGSTGIALINSCLFAGNQALESYGGALVNYPYMITLSNCTFQDNYAKETTACIYAFGGRLNITGSRFLKNRASYGSVLYTTTATQIFFSSCYFDNNSAIDGGVVQITGPVTFTDCSFYNNSAVFKGGLVDASGQITITFIRCHIFGTRAYEGGLFNLDSSYLFFQDGSISSTQSYFGAVVAEASSEIFFTNSIFTNTSVSFLALVFSFPVLMFVLFFCQARYAGLFLLRSFAAAYVQGCQLIDSFSNSQGSIYELLDESLLVINASIIRQAVSAKGAAIGLSLEQTTVQLINTEMDSNFSPTVGWFYVSDVSSLTVQSCTLSGQGIRGLMSLHFSALVLNCSNFSLFESRYGCWCSYS
jgi:predicted outer membrane repeat protein